MLQSGVCLKYRNTQMFKFISNEDVLVLHLAGEKPNIWLESIRLSLDSIYFDAEALEAGMISSLSYAHTYRLPMFILYLG